MGSSVDNILSKKNVNLVVGIVSILVCLWLVMFAVPSLFYYMFDTILGNLILIGIVVIASMKDLSVGLMVGIAFIILFRFSDMSSTESVMNKMVSKASSGLVEGFYNKKHGSKHYE